LTGPGPGAGWTGPQGQTGSGPGPSLFRNNLYSTVWYIFFHYFFAILIIIYRLYSISNTSHANHTPQQQYTTTITDDNDSDNDSDHDEQQTATMAKQHTARRGHWQEGARDERSTRDENGGGLDVSSPRCVFFPLFFFLTNVLLHSV
jgi:hypothetical protein